MIPLFRSLSMLSLAALCACSEEPHPLDRYLAQLRPVTVAALPKLNWPTGTLLCPLTPYQSELPISTPPADRVNAYLKKKQFKGDENHWSLVAIKPTSAGEAGIEQLVFKRGNYDVINEAEVIKRDIDAVPPGFTQRACIPVENAVVFVTKEHKSNQTLIIFGME